MVTSQVTPQYDFAYQPYKRPFNVPLQTHHGEWTVRQGIFVLLREQGTGAIGIGEISPLPWFGTESIQEAIAYCVSLPRVFTRSQIFAIPNQLPCSQFGFGTALETLQGDRAISTLTLEHAVPPASICGLLPTGVKALSDWPRLWEKGHRTFKWKIGVAPIAFELDLFRALMAALPSSAKLRLDANGGLNFEQAQQWGTECDRYCDNSASARIEYLEQPLPPDQWRSLIAFAADYRTPIALDESVATASDLQNWRQRHWPGYYILKPAIIGFPWEIRAVCQQIDNPKIFSSVFEARIGRTASLALAQDLGTPEFALGFGVDHWLAESPSVSISSSTFS